MPQDVAPPPPPPNCACARGRLRAGVARLAVRDMTCASCVSAVESALLALPGVKEASVNLLAGQAYAKYDPGVIGEVIARHTLQPCRSSTPATPHLDG
jgi:copper chaperone CopZ